MKPTVNQKYIILQGLFWMLYCATTGFISLCLLSRGLNNKEIGIVTASFGIISAVLQPLLGRICDQSLHMNWKQMIILLTIPVVIIYMLMTILSGKVWGILFVGMLLLLGNTIIPFINSALSDYQHQNIPINFGIARGTGSMMYALLALLIGKMALSYGTHAVSVSGIVISGFFLAVTLWMPCDDSQREKSVELARNRKGFVRRYPSFIMMFLAFIFLSTSHNLVGTYLLQLIQSLGGTSEEFGIAIAIQAVVEVPVLFAFTAIMKKINVQRIMLISVVGYGVKAIWYAVAGSVLAIYLVQFTQMISFALFASASVYYVMKEIDREDQVTGQALMTSIMAIGTVIGSFTGGVLIDQYGMKAMLTVNVFVALAGIILAFISVMVVAPVHVKKTIRV